MPSAHHSNSYFARLHDALGTLELNDLEAQEELKEVEEESDKTVAGLYGITDEELKEVKKTLRVLKGEDVMEPNIAAVLRHFESIREHIKQILSHVIKGGWVDYSEEEKILAEEFNDAKVQFERIRDKQQFDVNLRSIEKIPSTWAKEKAFLRMLDIECDKAIGVLESIATPLSKDELDKLTALREELEKLSEVLPDINYERNLKEAIEEYEKGDYLASALISGRVIIYALNQIPGGKDEERVEVFKEKGIIGKGKEGEAVRKSIIKASRSARNFLTHNIKGFPAPSEALSLLGDAIVILKLVGKVLEEEKIEK